MRFIAVLTAGALLAACSDDSTQYASTSIDGTEKPASAGDDPVQVLAYERREKEAVAARLRNPDTAKFSNVHMSKKGGARVVCGYVNAENGFGGMIGDQRFVSASAAGIVVLEEEMGDGEMDKLWSQMCG